MRGLAAYAAAWQRVLEHDNDIMVAATCDTAEDAIAALPRIAPDIVTMDIELPGIDGLRAVEEIMSAHPTPILMLLPTAASRRGQAAAALAAGALDAFAKPISTSAIRPARLASRSGSGCGC